MAGPDPLLLAEPAELAKFLDLPADDVRLLAALHAASARFRGAVRHPVTRVTGDVEQADGDGTRVLHLRAAPVTVVHLVTVDGVEVDDYRVLRRSGVLKRTAGVWQADAEIDVTYDHGYVVPPPEVAEVVVDQARAIYRLDPAIQQVSTGSDAVTFAATAAVGVSAQWTSAVSAYRLNRGDGA
ncbi:mobile element protein [Streptomyces sp. DSM 42041]|uniref:Mobile element protein n=1 Tax=Streptomyces hazeniae TaxID=3075538 RepID=A0ABU2NWR4_9ACTN|nr:mobile element protein [Streptomyces sp. DSM 42041]MDT0381429.1 mobile element protein [Streptomyces sp. DSM 42041]